MDKPLASAQLEPTYRKGGECCSEGTGRGSSRAFLGTFSLKFVLETEEKTRELLWADQKGLYSKIHTHLESQAQPWNLPPCPAHPRFSLLPSAGTSPYSQLLESPGNGVLLYGGWRGTSGAYQGSSFRKPFILHTGLTLSFTICGFPGIRKDDTSRLWCPLPALRPQPSSFSCCIHQTLWNTGVLTVKGASS